MGILGGGADREWLEPLDEVGNREPDDDVEVDFEKMIGCHTGVFSGLNVYDPQPGFEYIWEVYKPVAERRYGYYVLPILYGDRFVARFEPGRDRENGALIVKQWWWEPGIHVSEDVRSALRRCFERFLDYLGADGLRVDGRADAQGGLGWLAP